MADKKSKKEAPKPIDSSGDRHVVKSVRDYNLSTRTRKTILWGAGIFLIIGLFYSWYSIQEKPAGKKSAKTSQEIWYLSFSEHPNQREGVKVFDEGFGRCEKLVDNSTLFSMTCKGGQGYKTVDVFTWDKPNQTLGSWHRVGEKSVGGTFYLHKDPLGNYRGEVYASNKTTRAPLLLYKCVECKNT